MTHFGKSIRTRREHLHLEDKRFSLRQVAQRIGIEPAYLSKIRAGRGLAAIGGHHGQARARTGEDPDVLLALAGKVSGDLQNIIRKRPKLFAELIRQLKEAPDHALLHVVREVRDGEW